MDLDFTVPRRASVIGGKQRRIARNQRRAEKMKSVEVLKSSGLKLGAFKP